MMTRYQLENSFCKMNNWLPVRMKRQDKRKEISYSKMLQHTNHSAFNRYGIYFLIDEVLKTGKTFGDHRKEKLFAIANQLLRSNHFQIAVKLPKKNEISTYIARMIEITKGIVKYSQSHSLLFSYAIEINQLLENFSQLEQEQQSYSFEACDRFFQLLGQFINLYLQERIQDRV